MAHHWFPSLPAPQKDQGSGCVSRRRGCWGAGCANVQTKLCAIRSAPTVWVGMAMYAERLEQPRMRLVGKLADGFLKIASDEPCAPIFCTFPKYYTLMDLCFGTHCYSGIGLLCIHSTGPQPQPLDSLTRGMLTVGSFRKKQMRHSPPFFYKAHRNEYILVRTGHVWSTTHIE